MITLNEIIIQIYEFQIKNNRKPEVIILSKNNSEYIAIMNTNHRHIITNHSNKTEIVQKTTEIMGIPVFRSMDIQNGVVWIS